MMGEPNEQDLKAAVLTVGTVFRNTAASPETLERTMINRIAADRAAARAETWEKAIGLAKSVECLEGFSGHWQNGHAQAKAVIIGLLEAAAGSKNQSS